MGKKKETETTERAPQFAFAITPQLEEALAEVNERTGIKKSEFVRDAIWEKIAQTRQSHPVYQTVEN